MVSFLTLPLELLVSVSSYLPTSDLASLRLTCKQTEKSLYEWFSKEFFSKKQFMLTHASLQTFIAISKHVSFSKRLNHVIIATNVYSEAPQRFRDEQAAQCYLSGYEGQKVLLSTGIDREMLSEAFVNLVNLRTVGVRDFNAPRPRDEGSHWSSWGASTVYRETGVALRFSNREEFAVEIGSQFTSRVFTTVLYALGKAGRSPKEIEVLLRKGGLPDAAFALPNFLQPTLLPVLSALTTLLLNVDLNLRYFHTHTNGNITDGNAGRSLRELLTHTPNLTHLRLNFSKHAIEQNTGFLHWLGEAAPVQTVANFLDPAPIHLAHLRQLDLGQLNVRLHSLLPIVNKYAKTLVDLNLWRMGLHSHVPPPHGHQPSYWTELFKTMRRISELNLKHLKIGMLQQDHMHVNFKAEDPDKQALLKDLEHTGNDMDRFIESLEDRIIVNWPEPVEVESEVSDDEDEDMYDEEEEEEEEEEEGGDDE